MMSKASHLPRDYQMEELTRSITLPLPPLQQVHLRVIAESLAIAWEDLLGTQGSGIYSHNENEINALMESRLNHLDLAEWSTLVRGVTRGKESFNFNGKSIEKRPDLSIHLTRRNFLFPLSIECKIIDKNKGKGVELYCNKGLIRFLVGDYAWYAHEGFMLAYVRDKSAIKNCLKPHLEKNQKKQPDAYLTQQLPLTVDLPPQDFAQSQHGRGFPNNPGSIILWHLWLT